MNSKAVYNSDRTARVVCRGTNFFFQRLGGGKGTREFDPWIDDSRPMSREKALARLASAEVKKKEVA